jgi:hypothetical protein
MLRKTHVVRKVERGIDSDEEGAVLPPTTTHRYNYAVDKVKALANTKGCRYIRIVLFAKFNVSRCLLKLQMAVLFNRMRLHSG